MHIISRAKERGSTQKLQSLSFRQNSSGVFFFSRVGCWPYRRDLTLSSWLVGNEYSRLMGNARWFCPSNVRGSRKKERKTLISFSGHSSFARQRRQRRRQDFYRFVTSMGNCLCIVSIRSNNKFRFSASKCFEWKWQHNRSINRWK